MEHPQWKDYGWKKTCWNVQHIHLSPPWSQPMACGKLVSCCLVNAFLVDPGRLGGVIAVAWEFPENNIKQHVSVFPLLHDLWKLLSVIRIYVWLSYPVHFRILLLFYAGSLESWPCSFSPSMLKRFRHRCINANPPHISLASFW